MVSWRRFGIGTISASGHYAVNLPMSTNKKQMIGKDTYLLLLKDMPRDQFNTDETAIFERQLPRKSMVIKGESCKGGKFAKERLSIMLCCSATGEKLKPLIIGNAARSHAFKQNNVTPDNLPVTWKHNKKAWMTMAVFEDWLNDNV
jgi:hypothetical protein